MEDRHFNRCCTGTTREYIEDRGGQMGRQEHDGFIKCKLVHGAGYSVIIPDQIYLKSEGPLMPWIQPLSFAGCVIAELDDEKVCDLYVDISCRQTVRIRFCNHDFIRRFDDGAELFHCTIIGPTDLPEYSTGTAILSPDNEPCLDLFHFTKPETQTKIEKSEFFLPSPWNIQGNKKLSNVGYAYFTCLDSLTCDADLKQIAMASDAIIHLVTDLVTPPESPTREWVAQHSGDVLALPVYRESTANRTARIDIRIPASILAPQHIHRHQPPGGAVYYDICKAFIYRVGLEPGTNLPIHEGMATVSSPQIKRFDYIVLGTATTMDGLLAPYDEEVTKEKFLIERPQGTDTILDFWISHANRDLVTGRKVDLQQFQREP